MYLGNLFSTPWGWVILISLILLNIGSFDLAETLITLPAIIIAITFHEFAHAWVADRLGDDIPRRQGRLTLNPLAHIDPIGFVLLIFCGFGWGKPVNINQYNFRRTISMKKGTALVALAGPVMNFILAFAFAIIEGLIYRFAPQTFSTNSGIVFCKMLEECQIINVGLGVFNLIPLPPLDGSKILVALLPKKAEDWYMLHQDMLQLIFIIIWITPIISYIMMPMIRGALIPVYFIKSLISG